MNLSIFKNFYTEHRRSILLTAFSILFFAVLSSVAFAQTTPAPTGRPNPLGADNGAGFDLFKPLAELIYVIALGVGGVFVFVGGLALDLSIQQLIIQFGGLFNSAFGQGVVSVWQIIRDIFNIVFIFAFIYIGIRTILNSEDSGTRRAIGNLIVAALFINFSLFISQAIIDFSNVAATQIYNHITTGGVGASGIDGTFSNELMDLGQNSISGAFLNLTNLTTLFGGDTDILKDEKMTASKILVYSILMMVFLVLAGFIFLFAAIHIIYRFVALIIYMILSPVLFAGLILPNFQSYTKKWLHGLLKQSFFAPAFLFLIYVSLLSMKTLKESLVLGGGMFQDITEGGAMDVNEFGIFLYFAITIGFIYASVKVGDMMGIAGAGATLKMVDGARKNVQGWAYRNTAGRGLDGVLKGYDRLDRSAAKGDTGARVLRTVLGGETGRRALETAKNYGAGGRGIADQKKLNDTKKNDRAERISGFDERTSLIKSIKEGKQATSTTQQKIAMESALAGASASDLAKLASDEKEFNELVSVSGNIPEKKFESLMDSKDLSPKQKDALRTGRVNSVKANIEKAGGGDFKKGIMGASPDELNTLEFQELINNAMYVQSGQIDKLESKWGDEKMRIFKEERKKAILSEFTTNPSVVLNSRKGDKEIAKLPTDIFTTHKDILLDELLSTNKLTGGLLQSIAADSGMSGAEKKQFGTAVQGRYTGTPIPKDIDNFFKSSMGAAFN
jgi:hypothetical protein